MATTGAGAVPAGMGWAELEAEVKALAVLMQQQAYQPGMIVGAYCLCGGGAVGRLAAPC